MAICAMRIETDDPALRHEARAIVDRLALPLTEAPSHPTSAGALTLAMRDVGLELRDAATRPGRGLRIDLGQIVRRGGLSRRQPLPRAVGLDSRRVIDATAGLGHDATLLAIMGFDVLAIERNDVLAALLNDAMRRAAWEPATTKALGGRLRIMHGDARRLLVAESLRADCIYLDPMFPAKRKASALPSKEIRLVRMLVGDDEDSEALLRIARSHAPRVAVKRPHHAPPLSLDVQGEIQSKLVRYDIYRGEAASAG